MDTILDCYTDEPAGLGVPPYLGTYPRYLYGYLGQANYLTIDDLRFLNYYGLNKEKKEISHKTNIKIFNLTKNISRIKEILSSTERLFVILGVHTPGKYLSAIPGTLEEVSELIRDIPCEKILTGPAIFGTQLEGGKFFEKVDDNIFKKKENQDFSYDEISDYAIKGTDLTDQIPDLRIAEIETGHGCPRKKGCSFCTEPIKHRLEFRKNQDILKEVKALYSKGIKHFRLGKQSDFYMHPDSISLLKEIRASCPDINVLHIDNVNPESVISEKGEEITKAIVKYCTEGNIAAFGVESFDPVVCKENNLNSDPKTSYSAVKLLNKFGSERGENGMPKFLPGINILFGLKGEAKSTHQENMGWLKRILDEDLLLRRINIRQVTIFQGTQLYQECGSKYLKKNKKFYWKWRNDIRQNIDLPMLGKIVPKGSILKDVRAEIYDGNTTFARQVGTYPLIVGIKRRLELNRFYDVKITEHMLRSVTAEVSK